MRINVHFHPPLLWEYSWFSNQVPLNHWKSGERYEMTTKSAAVKSLTMVNKWEKRDYDQGLTLAPAHLPNVGKIQQWHVTVTLTSHSLYVRICVHTHTHLAYRTGPQPPSGELTRMSSPRGHRSRWQWRVEVGTEAEVLRWRMMDVDRQTRDTAPRETHPKKQAGRDRERQVARLRLEVDEGNVPELNSTGQRKVTLVWISSNISKQVRLLSGIPT